MSVEELAVSGVSIAVVIGVTQILKPFIPSKFHPLTSLALGILVGGGTLMAQGVDWITSLISGIIVGLSASGLYDQKAIVNK